MTAQTLQQTASKARNAKIIHVASISLVLVLLMAGALAYFNITGTPPTLPAARPLAATAPRSPAVPALWSTGSAYDGAAYGRVQALVGAETRNPINHASSSAYDGN